MIACMYNSPDFELARQNGVRYPWKTKEDWFVSSFTQSDSQKASRCISFRFSDRKLLGHEVMLPLCMCSTAAQKGLIALVVVYRLEEHNQSGAVQNRTRSTYILPTGQGNSAAAWFCFQCHLQLLVCLSWCGKWIIMIQIQQSITKHTLPYHALCHSLPVSFDI